MILMGTFTGVNEDSGLKKSMLWQWVGVECGGAVVVLLLCCCAVVVVQLLFCCCCAVVVLLLFCCCSVVVLLFCCCEVVHNITGSCLHLFDLFLPLSLLPCTLTSHIHLTHLTHTTHTPHTHSPRRERSRWSSVRSPRWRWCHGGTE